MPRRTVSDKVLYYKVFSIAKYSKYDGYQGGFAIIVYNFLIKTHFFLTVSGVLI